MPTVTPERLSVELVAPKPSPQEPPLFVETCHWMLGVGVPEEQTYSGRLSARGIEAVNAGVPGFDSYSGLRQLEGSSLLSLHPRLVTIYFAWNDHWRQIATERTFARLRRLSQYSRTAAFLLKLQASIWSQNPCWRRFRWISAVPLGQFKENLREMIAESRRSGAVVVLITAPAEAELAEENADFFASHSLAELQEHPRYTQAVREVAAETGAGLVDLERELQRRASRDPHEYFIDFAHLNAKGHRLLADLLVPFVP